MKFFILAELFGYGHVPTIIKILVSSLAL